MSHVGRNAEASPPAAQVLEAFMSAAATLGEVQALCELAARTLAALEHAPARVYIRDLCGPDAPLLWVAAAPCGAQPETPSSAKLPSPRPAAEAPLLVRTDLDAGGLARHEAVPAAALELSGDELSARVDALSVGSHDALHAWLGVCSAQSARPGLAPGAGELWVRLLAHHLLACVARVRAEQGRQNTERKYRTLVEQIPAVTYYRDLDQPGSASFMSPQSKSILGYEPERFIENRAFFLDCVHPEDRARVQALQASLSVDDLMKPTSVEYRMLHRDGRTMWLKNLALATCDAEGNPRFLIGIIFDITETKQLEQQYLHAQKTEAVGRLAGGIAHDFNNILTVIIGHAEFVAETLERPSQCHADIEVVLDAAERARRLVRQLLSFSRPQTPKVTRLRLAEVLDGMRAMVSRVLASNITLEFVDAPTLGSTLADRGQLEQVIMNLLVNARDAMPEGGRLRVEGSNITLDETLSSACEPIPAGDYVSFCVSDSGVGMDEYTVERLFEPFFTTKPQGTGLGMSTVLSLVRQHGGTLAIDSEPGRGTEVRVYLPRCPEPLPGESAPPR